MLTWQPKRDHAIAQRWVGDCQVHAASIRFAAQPALGSLVPMSRILVTGMSATGKSSALAELGRRGYRVVDTDDPGWREYRTYEEPTDEIHRGEWLWVEEKIAELLDSDDGRTLFVQGCVRNQTTFYD